MPVSNSDIDDEFYILLSIPSVFNMVQLFNSENVSVMSNLGKYVCKASKLSNDVIC
jgi:hypothetical protein